MAKFSYIVKDSNGKTIAEVAEAFDKKTLVQSLQSKGYFIVSIQELRYRKSAKTKKQQQKKTQFTHAKIKLDDLLVFASQLATMMEAGVTLLRSLDVILTQCESKQFSRVLTTIRKDVEQGKPLSQALEKHPAHFNQFWTSLIEVGEASGTMPTVLNKLAFYLEQQSAFRSAILSAIIYPAILFLVACGAVLFFAFWVAPKFESIFASLGSDLPLITKILLNLFKYLKSNFLFIGLGFYGFFLLFSRYIKTYKGRLNWEKFLFGLPVVGNTIKLIVIERFASMMAILIDSGVPILHALDISQRLVDNNTCSLIINNIKEGVREGRLLVSPMEESGFFPPLAIQMITVGEETGELSKMLKHVSVFYQNAVETFMKRFGTIIEPIMLIFMGGIIGVIVLAMFLPMFNIATMGV